MTSTPHKESGSASEIPSTRESGTGSGRGAYDESTRGERGDTSSPGEGPGSEGPVGSGYGSNSPSGAPALGASESGGGNAATKELDFGPKEKPRIKPSSDNSEREQRRLSTRL